MVRPQQKAADPMLIIADLLFNMHAEFQQSPDDNMVDNHERNNVSGSDQVFLQFCHTDAWGGDTTLGCFASTPSLQSAQIQRAHRSSKEYWLGPVTVFAIQEMLVCDT